MVYRREIDGLRSVAVVLVLIFHARPDLLPGGFIGVDVFFVISGFLIGSLLLKQLDEGGISILHFYARRLKRVVPALVVVIVCTVLFGSVYLTPDEMDELANSAAAAAFGISNIYFWRTTSYFASDAEFKPLLTTWSLGVEEQFYLLTPILLILVARFRRSALVPAIAALCAVSLAVSIVMTHRWPSGAYYLLPSRWFELGVGLLLAGLWDTPWMARLRGERSVANLIFLGGIALVVFGAMLISRSYRFPGFLALVPTIATVMIISAQNSNWAAATLGSAPAVGVGLISYSLYLWHWPLLSFARIGTGGHISDEAVAVIMVAVFALSYLSWRFVEMPFRHFSLPPTRIVAGALAATGVTAGVAFAAELGNRAFVPFPASIANLDAQAKRLRGDKCLIGGRDFAMPPEECIGLTEHAVALVGDSHAAALSPSLKRLVEAKGYGFAQLTRSNCPPLIAVRREIQSWPANGISCEEHNRYTFDLIKAEQRIEVVVLSAFWSAPFVDRVRDPEGSYVDSNALHGDSHETIVMRNGLERTVSELEAQGKRVIVVGDVPVFRFHPLVRERSQVLPLRAWVLERVALRGRTIDAGTSFETETGPGLANSLIRNARRSTMVDAEAILCEGGSCRFKSGAGLLYTDQHHLSDAGAEMVLRPVNAMLTEN